MKLKHLFCALLMGFCAGDAIGQQNPVIPVSRNKTTFIVIHNTRCESANLGGEKGAVLCEEHPTSRDSIGIVKLQAIKEHFTTTNLLVVCTDTLMEFTLKYDPDPAVTRYTFRYAGRLPVTAGTGTTGAAQPVIPDSVTQAGITVAGASLHALQQATPQIKRSVKEEGLYLFLDNIGLDSGDRHHFFRLRLRNTTAVAYTIDYVQFVVEAKKDFSIRARAGATAQDDYPPYFSAPTNRTTIAGGDEQELIFACDKLPLPTGQQLQIIMKEQAASSRGRTITLKMPAIILKDRKKVLRL